MLGLSQILTPAVYSPCVTALVIKRKCTTYSTYASLFGPITPDCSARIRPPCLLTQVTVPTDSFPSHSQAKTSAIRLARFARAFLSSPTRCSRF